MKSSFLLTTTLLIVFLCEGYSQNFEGRFSYENYNIVESDTIESSSMNYWVKDHLYKHTGYVPKMPFYDLGTLYADADNMSRTNVDNSGKVERIPMSLEANVPSLKVEETDEVEEILGFKCKVWDLVNAKTDDLVSKLWITKEIQNSNFDQFVEIFNYGNTLFPCKGIQGWILKREDYRREGKIFVSEAKEVQPVKLNISEMVVY